jgi:hypothetical protein
MKPALHIAPCTYEAAAFAVTRWHYSAAMPSGKIMRYGVWEAGEFVGAVVFGRGANIRIASEYGLTQTEVCELVRVALRGHVTPVSRILSFVVRLVRKDAPGLRLIISYADPVQGHHGGIYQACGWTYTGTSRPQRELVINGRDVHKRSVVSRFGTASVPALLARGVHVDYGEKRHKLKYVLPLDDAMRAQIAPLTKPYPKRADSPTRAGSIVADAPSIPDGEGGSVPTPALHSAHTVPYAHG